MAFNETPQTRKDTIVNKIVIAKKTISVIVTSGTGKIVSDIIKSNTTPSESTIDKVTYTVGAYALGAMIAAKTAEFTDAKVDEIVAIFKKASATPTVVS